MGYTRLFAKFVQKLNDTPVGDGSLLDHSLLLFGSGIGNGNLHEKFESPTVTVGGANGRGLGNRQVKPEKGESACNFLADVFVFELELEQIGPSTDRRKV